MVCNGTSRIRSSEDCPCTRHAVVEQILSQEPASKLLQERPLGAAKATIEKARRDRSHASVTSRDDY